MQVPAGPKGTRDFFPENMALQEHLFSSWKKTCERYGFELYDGPMFEHLELYKQKSGDEIEDQLYFFKDKKGRDLALRPEMTPSLARMVASRGRDAKLPLRWYSIPRLFRYEKMQKGRLREFFQLNMDILGIAEVSADAELIAAVIDMMRDLGFTAEDFKVRISSRTLLEELFIAAGLARETCAALYALLDKKSKIPSEEFERDLMGVVPDALVRTKIEAIFGASSFDEICRIGDGLPSVKDLLELFSLLSSYGFSDYAVFDIGIVRGLAYYTGIVFEVFDIRKSLRAIAGGGRYDKLVSLYGGPPTPAVGFAAGDVVLGELLKEKGLVPALRPRSICYCIAVSDSDSENVIALARELRNRGVSCEFPLKNTGIGKQLKLANAARSLYALFIGGAEGAEGMVKVKTMATGEETLMPRNEIVGKMTALAHAAHESLKR
jgi:histidyl-tRNA synthetase